MEGFMCDFWLPGGNVVKRQRVYNYSFQSTGTVNPATQQLPSQISPLYLQLQTVLIENTNLKDKICSLEKKLAGINPVNEKSFTKGKPFSSLSPCRKRHRKQPVKEFLISVSKKLPPDWHLEEAKFRIDGHTEPILLKLNNQSCEAVHVNTSVAAEDEMVKKALLAKDKALLNDAGYHELKMVPGSGLPSLTRLRKERKRQNAEIPIEPIHRAIKGYGCQRKIKDILEYLLEMKDFEDIFEGEAEPTIRLRFAGDGRQTSKKIGTVMAVFSVLQEGKHKPNYQ